ncbi:M23 family metallopeptidase [Agromyces mariniharenae]|nr:M23 family metallopeptidase [Agromyces mariniharenae]
MFRAAGVLLVVLAVAIIGPIAVVVTLLASGAEAASCAPPQVVDSPVAELDAEQTQNAGILIGAAKALFPDEATARRAALVAIATALQESGLRNIDHGDRDSLGLFQQRPSMGWGTPEQIMDPAYAAGRFYQALAQVAGWQQLPVTIAAQKVQISGFPDAYAKWESTAAATIDTLWAHVGPVSIPAEVGWTGMTGSAADAAQNTGGCIASGELVLPLAAGYTLTDGYGWRNLGMGTNPFHRGVDLAADCGTPVYAMMSGRVVSADSLTILIETPGAGQIGYLHTAPADHLVRPGDRVAAGQQISAVGTQPPSTGCHLDVRVNPEGATDPRVLALVPDPGAGGWVDPEEFTRAFGVGLCGPEVCTRAA